MVVRGSVALVCIDTGWVSAVKVGAGSTFEKYLSTARSGPGRDLRVVAGKRDSDQVRFLSFRDSVTRIKEQLVPERPLKGVRAACEATVALRDAGQNSWEQRRTTWVRRSGVPEIRNTAHEHRMIRTLFFIFQQFDQLDLYTIAGIEYLIRRLKQLEAATRRNLCQPDFEGRTSCWTPPSTSRAPSCSRVRQLDRRPAARGGRHAQGRPSVEGGERHVAQEEGQGRH